MDLPKPVKIQDCIVTKKTAYVEVNQLQPMSEIPKKTGERLLAGLKRFQPILDAAKKRDVNEADTVTIVTDIISDVFGFDKYTEISSEHRIRISSCDMAIKIEDKVQFMIEVKAIGHQGRAIE